MLRSLPTLIIAFSIVSLLSYELWRSYSVASDDAERRILNLVHFISDQFSRSVKTVELTLDDVADDLANGPALPDNEQAFRDALQKRLTPMPFVRSIFVIGPDGHVSQDTNYPSVPRGNLSTQDYFKFHKSDPSAALHVGRPTKDLSSGAWSINLSLRIDTADGRFGGVVVASMEPLFIESFYQRIWVRHGTIALALADGTLLAKSPASGQVMGTPFADIEPVLALLGTGNPSVAWLKGPTDGLLKVVGYKQLETVPIVVYVAATEANVMQTWRSHAAAGLVGAAILLALLTLLEFLSHRSRRREEAARRRLEAAQRLEAIGRFAGGIAHDCGNLMRIIHSASVILRLQLKDKPEALTLLDEVDTSLDVGRGLVNRLLAYARNTETWLEIVNPVELVEEILPIARQAAGPGVEVSTRTTREELLCLIDGTQFQAAVVNLVLNARDAMPSGGTIMIDVRPADDPALAGERRWLDVSVEDNGIGMTEDVRRRAFDPFFTIKEPGKGHGVGLSQAWDFVQRSNGHADIFSRPGEGTTVRLRFPVQDRHRNGNARSTSL